MKQKDKKAPKESTPAKSKKKSAQKKDPQEILDTLEQEKGQLLEKLQRVSADYANYQKRVPKQITDAVSYEKEKILKSLLPALDNFEHTLQGAEKAENIDILCKGIRIVYDQMLDILKSHKVEQIQTVNEPFDPMRHEAMLRRSDPEKEDNTVLEEFQRGYVLNDRVIRPSKVIVNKIEIAETVDPDEQDENQNQQDAESSEPSDME